MMTLKKSLKTLIVATSLLSLVGVASAHVTVWPKQSTTGIEEKYTVRVPDEKEQNTVKVRVVFPKGVDVDSVQPQAGWNYTFEKDSSGNNTALTWTATAGGIKPDQFAEFSFIGANPKTAGDLTWNAYQTYADGSTEEWTGAPNADTPSPITKVTATAAEGNQQAQQTVPAQQPTTGTTSSNTVPLILSGVALLLALISLFRKRA